MRHRGQHPEHHRQDMDGSKAHEKGRRTGRSCGSKSGQSIRRHRKHDADGSTIEDAREHRLKRLKTILPVMAFLPMTFRFPAAASLKIGALSFDTCRRAYGIQHVRTHADPRSARRHSHPPPHLRRLARMVSGEIIFSLPRFKYRATCATAFGFTLRRRHPARRRSGGWREGWQR